MPVVSSTIDPQALTLTIVTSLDASVDRVWQIWADPRQLERWWGPPTWPASFPRYEFVEGGQARYVMTGPEGEASRAWWTFRTIDAPRSLTFDDGFADEAGEPDLSIPPMLCAVSLEEVEATTRMTIVTTFSSLESLEQMNAMGMQEGMGLAMGQIDGLLADPVLDGSRP